MAHPTLDLPDPLDSPGDVSPADVSLGRAEDLLSQLAGDEIDRLMTEPAPRLATQAAREVAREVPRLPAHPLALATEPDQEIVSVSPAELQALSAQLGSFFDAVDEGLLSPALPSSHFEGCATNGEVTIELIRRDGHLDDEYPPENLLENRPARQVRAALTAPFDADPTPAYLKPLEWLANPIAALSASARRAVGALAVVSFLSAAGLLAYVLMLRNG